MATRFGNLSTIVFLGALVACSKKTPEPAKSVASVATAAPADETKTAKADDGSGQGMLDPTDPKHGTRKLMGLDTPVFVDGVQSAVLRAGEMPALSPIVLEGGAKRYRVYDYLKAIGVAPEHLKSIHFHGNGDRIASVEGSELLKDKDRFVFQFTSGDTGAPLQEWDTDGLKNPFVANEIRRVTVYVTKAAPAIHPQKRCHLDAKGECSDAIPYSNGEIAKGTRVYVDGKMVGFVKRRQIGDALALGETPAGEHKFSVAKLVTSMGVDASGIAQVELMAGDDVIARAKSAQWNALANDVYFTLPKHNHGKVRVHVPASFQDGSSSVDRDAMVSAVLVYKSTKPADRELTAISEQTDLSVQLAAMDGARDKLARGER
jgi:hypothetical protein